MTNEISGSYKYYNLESQNLIKTMETCHSKLSIVGFTSFALGTCAEVASVLVYHFKGSVLDRSPLVVVLIVGLAVQILGIVGIILSNCWTLQSLKSSQPNES